MGGGGGTVLVGGRVGVSVAVGSGVSVGGNGVSVGGSGVSVGVGVAVGSGSITPHPLSAKSIQIPNRSQATPWVVFFMIILLSANPLLDWQYSGIAPVFLTDKLIITDPQQVASLRKKNFRNGLHTGSLHDFGKCYACAMLSTAWFMAKSAPDCNAW